MDRISTMDVISRSGFREVPNRMATNIPSRMQATTRPHAVAPPPAAARVICFTDGGFLPFPGLALAMNCGQDAADSISLR
jgi:hypothetical protein